MIEKLIKHLQDKHDAFIGNQKDQITSAEARGFKQGLAWAIESAESQIREAQAEHEWNLEQEENERVSNAYLYDEGGNCDGFPR
jgi:hypothetical protein